MLFQIVLNFKKDYQGKPNWERPNDWQPSRCHASCKNATQLCSEKSRIYRQLSPTTTITHSRGTETRHVPSRQICGFARAGNWDPSLVDMRPMRLNCSLRLEHEGKWGRGQVTLSSSVVERSILDTHSSFKYLPFVQQFVCCCHMVFLSLHHNCWWPFITMNIKMHRIQWAVMGNKKVC